VESTARDEKGTSSKARKQGGAATKSESADRSATGASTKRTKQPGVTAKSASAKNAEKVTGK
ncbi:unnamed protein product, partial [Rotaria magnacalcarata]